MLQLRCVLVTVCLAGGQVLRMGGRGGGQMTSTQLVYVHQQCVEFFSDSTCDGWHVSTPATLSYEQLRAAYLHNTTTKVQLQH